MEFDVPRLNYLIAALEQVSETSPDGQEFKAGLTFELCQFRKQKAQEAQMPKEPAEQPLKAVKDKK
jgi:hypothetical protein